VAQLRSQLGADADAPLRELETIERELLDLRDETERLNDEAGAAAETRGRALREQELAADALEGHVAAAAEAATRLDVLRRNDVWAVVAPGEPVPPAGAGD